MKPVSAIFSSKQDTWETPQDFFDKLNEEFDFTLDPCCSEQTAKCKKYFTPSEDGLRQSWAGETVYCNPPYGRAIAKWVRKAYEECQQGATVVMLLPSRTDTKWFHHYIYGKAEILFVEGRLRFGGSTQNAPFPNMVVIFKPERLGKPS